MYLYDELNGARKYGGLQPMPEYIAANLNPSFDLRPYQREAFENFVTHFESASRPKPTQVLFHMATGSGKTLIMAGLIVYLYARGYRNFLFFVNLTNILDKTRDNFTEPTSEKYLFAKELNIGGRRVRVNVVENFQRADAEAINLCFTTTQGLHMAMNFVKENDMTVDDFRERKTVLISDEAHHLNVGTRLNATEETSRLNWEQTVERILDMNSANVLLEFTATCDVANPSIRAKYEDKIAFDYPLKKFYTEGYSKEIITFRTADRDDRVLTALVMSQYRLKVFGDNRLSVKPVVLFKAAKIKDSEAFQKIFVERMKDLRGSDLRSLSERSGDEMLKRAFAYFAGKSITFDMLADELREGFSERHCISANNDTDAGENQRLLNSLEAAKNPYRAVFEVKKLDEGWDVLNLFDIVRLYETRSSKKATIAEAQLIGRGARYCPFQLNDAQPEYQRKYDGDTGNALRVCETLYYHCQNDRRYIAELHEALREIGLDIESGVDRTYKLTEPFKSDKLYRTGVMFLNRRELVRQKFHKVIPVKLYGFERIGGGGRDKVMGERVESVNREVKLYTTRRTFADIAAQSYAIVHKALRQHPPFIFDRLRERFGVKSTREFITSDEFLGGVAIDIRSDEREPGIGTLYAAAFDVLGKIGAALDKAEKEYRGTTDFDATPIQAVFRDKTVHYHDTVAGGLGDSQSDSLATADWFAYNDNFGTSEEKAFVEYFSGRVDELKKRYSKVYLVRNERLCGIYAFDDGRRFEPDFVLFLQRNDGDALEQFQIFIEPKGTHLLEHDAWKEKFLRELTAKNIVKKLDDNETCTIWGLPFYNARADKLDDFDKAFGDLLKP